MLPQNAQYLFDGALKSRILNAREAGQDEQLAVRRYFVEFLRQYALANPVARAKVVSTIAAIAPDLADADT